MVINLVHLASFEKHVREVAKDKKFIHNQWFVQYHLEIVEQIALEACELYPEANKDFVQLLCWLHDYGKILDFDNQYQKTLSEGQKKLREIGFSEEVIEKAVESIRIIDSKVFKDISAASIEIRIVSSADAASHHVGPFFKFWWHENPTRTIDQLLKDDVEKSEKDWQRKMVIPEIREAFAERRKIHKEQSGMLPNRYL